MNNKPHILAIIGLGNPGHKFERTRHNIGFIVVDALADRHHGAWQKKDAMETTTINLGEQQVILIKPQTFMNDSGRVIPFLLKKGIKAENILVVHDELQLPFGKLKMRQGGSPKGHNGLRSIIQVIGQDFPRLSIGIARPERKEDVGNYVLQNFSESHADLQVMVDAAVTQIESLF